jgi:threonine dehydrogenase-like Zn-dependent dehydrogenase
MNQSPVKRQWPRLFEHIRNGHLEPRDVVTHRIPLEHIAEGYHLFSPSSTAASSRRPAQPADRRTP